MTKVLVIAGASAVGKTTAVHKIIEKDNRFELVRSITSRAKRGDSFDSEYIYVTRDEFLDLIPSGGVLEYTEYSGNLYGTPRSEIERISGEGKVPLLILDLNGVRSFRQAEGISSCTVYIYDELCVMESRLRERYLSGTPSDEDHKRYNSRMKQNVTDYLSIGEYEPYLYSFVKSSDIDGTAESVLSVFESFLKKSPKDEKLSKQIAELLIAMAE